MKIATCNLIRPGDAVQIFGGNVSIAVCLNVFGEMEILIPVNKEITQATRASDFVVRCVEREQSHD